jgi:hypothetical protein
LITSFHVVYVYITAYFLISREGHRLRVFEDRVPRRICEPKREDDAENCLMSSIIYTLHKILLG